MNIIDLQERLFSDNLWTKRGGGCVVFSSTCPELVRESES